MTAPSILWRRLDAAGHDACLLREQADGWRLNGTAVFRHDDGAAQLAYEITCDRAWRSERGRVRGWLGPAAVDLTVARDPEGDWTVNGSAVSGLGRCPDLDLGFTPATNLIALRRLHLDVGQVADAPAAWLDVATARLDRLDQRYERRTESTYWYEAPSVGYAGLLEVSPLGFVLTYPRLWQVER